MQNTPSLRLPLIAAQQAQKHVSVNELALILDQLVHCSISEWLSAAPPASPPEGARYIVPPAPTGSWAGRSGWIAAWQDGNWFFHQPRDGWLAWSRGERALLVFHNGEWQRAGNLSGASVWGVNATADTSSRLAVRAEATLLSHENADHRLKINKGNPSGTSSVIFQDGFAGMAEVGLCGSNDLRIRTAVSTESWIDALVVDRTNGRVVMPATTAASQRNLLINGDFAINQRSFAGGALTAGLFGYDRWKAGPSGATLSVNAQGLVTLSSGTVTQVLEVPIWAVGTLAGSLVTISCHSPSADLTVTLASVSGTIAGGSGRRAVTLQLPATLSSHIPVSIGPASTPVTFSNIKLETGNIMTAWNPRTTLEELSLCQRYFAKSHAAEVAPANGQAASGLMGIALLSNLIASQRIQLPTTMRVAPTVAFLSGQVGTPVDGRWAFYQAGSWPYASSIYPTGTTASGFAAEMIVSGITAGAAYMVFGGWTASAEL